eukprot:TRINITY_DN5836_c0_g1_i1.p1 TRINITY_DN5836_c0_g1~~TRINITY_DN5836_c0_g1_i1.p1  ORF type:complete len:111 (-),score=11.53 TRINITY_DN5836_c0_g1_i1:60-392(-)
MLRRPPRSTLSSSSAASDVYKRQSKYSEPCGGGDAQGGGCWVRAAGVASAFASIVSPTCGWPVMVVGAHARNSDVEHMFARGRLNSDWPNSNKSMCRWEPSDDDTSIGTK